MGAERPAIMRRIYSGLARCISTGKPRDGGLTTWEAGRVECTIALTGWSGRESALEQARSRGNCRLYFGLITSADVFSTANQQAAHGCNHTLKDISDEDRLGERVAE